MANLLIKDGGTFDRRLKSSGVGTDADPYVMIQASDFDPLHRAQEEIFSLYGDRVSISSKMRSLNIFGRNEAIGASRATIMELQGAETVEALQTTNSIDRIISDDAAFTGIVVIEGHTISGGILTFVKQEATLNGQTAVILATPLARATRIEYKRGDGNALAATKKIYVYENGATTAGVPDTDSAVHLQMQEKYGRSQKAQTAISNDEYWIITKIYAGVLRKTSAVSNIEVRTGFVGDPLQTALELPASSTGSQFTDFPLGNGFMIVPKNHDLLIAANASIANVEIVAGAFGYLASVEV